MLFAFFSYGINKRANHQYQPTLHSHGNTKEIQGTYSSQIV
jgi:hypothetical protein